jgi:hypothetical protein
MTTQPAMPIAVKGQHVGTAIDHRLGVQFLALDARVLEMDRSIWPSAEYPERAASQMLRSCPERP